SYAPVTVLPSLPPPGALPICVTLVNPSWTATDMLTPETREVLLRYGYHIDDVDHVAERAVNGLVAGRHEVSIGGLLEMLGPYVEDRKSTRLNSSHVKRSYAVF